MPKIELMEMRKKMNLDEDDIMRLEIILDDLESHSGDNMANNLLPFISVDAEYLKHIVAKLRNRKCEDCGQVFKSDDNN